MPWRRQYRGQSFSVVVPQIGTSAWKREIFWLFAFRKWRGGRINTRKRGSQMKISVKAGAEYRLSGGDKWPVRTRLKNRGAATLGALIASFGVVNGFQLLAWDDNYDKITQLLPRWPVSCLFPLKEFLKRKE